MNLSALRETFRRNQWTTVLIQYLLVSLMLACLGATLSNFVRLLAPDVDPLVVVALAFLVTVESMYAWRASRNLVFPTPEWLATFLSEFVVLLLFVKLSLYAVRGWGFLLQELPTWQRGLGNFFDDQYVLVLLVVLTVWALARAFAATLWELEGDELFLLAGEDTGYLGNRREVRQRLADLILFTGAPMVILTGMLRANLSLLGISRPPFQAGFGNVLLYFLLALILLSLTQFAVMRSRWGVSNIAIPADLAKRWALYSALFLALVAMVAALLPTRYSYGLIETLNYALVFLVTIVQLIMAFILGLFGVLVSILLSLLGRPETVQEQPAPMPTLPPPDFGPPGAPIPWLELLKSVIFWLVFLGVIFISVRAYLRQHPELLSSLGRVRGLRWFGEVWRRLAGWFGSARSGIASVVSAQVQRLRSRRSAGTGPGSWRYMNPRHLSPRQRVFFFYLALLRRGQETGLSRAPSQTPYEYARVLEEALKSAPPDTQGEAGGVITPVEDVAALTEQFMEARYTRHEVTPEVAGMVQRTWERLRRAFRKALRPRSP